MTTDDLIKLRGTFRDADGNVVDVLTDDVPYVIVAGPWPNNVGARQVRCASCNGFCGLSPKGYAMLQHNPKLHPIFCSDCWVIIDANVQWLEKATKKKINRYGTCIFCGCTDDHACPGGCKWADPSHAVCSSDDCVGKLADLLFSLRGEA